MRFYSEMHKNSSPKLHFLSTMTWMQADSTGMPQDVPFYKIKTMVLFLQRS